MRALILVDLQNDFFPGGALGVKEGDAILPAINRLLEQPFDCIVASKDWHPKNHISFATVHNKQVGTVISHDGIQQILWPEHCIRDTHGAEFAPGWNHRKVEKIVHKGTEQNIDSYSTFFDNEHLRSTGLDEFLINRGIKEIYLAGLTTEYCVKYSAIDGQELGFRVFVVQDGCRGVNLHPHDDERAISAMRNAGVKIVQSQDV